MISFDNLEVFQTSPDKTVVVWSFKKTNDELTGLFVTVYRSHSPSSDFREIASVPYPQRYFIDESGDRFDQWRKAYYKVSAQLSNKVIEAGPDTIGSELFPLAQEMIRRIDIELRFSGVPVMVYLKRKGERCPDCWDANLKKATRSSCPTCFATGYVGGYHDPILTLANKIPEEESNQPDVTLRQNPRTALKMSVFPIIRPEDIIYHVNTPDRWRVVSVQPNVIHDNMVGQDPIVVAKLNPTDVEHSLPMPKGLSYVIQPHWEMDIRSPRDKVAHPDGTVEKISLWRPR